MSNLADAVEGRGDAEQRRTALDVQGSFVVQAPAGSGKTELLVRRFLALLAGVERPESVLAITFTRKAAGEMRERILKALRGAAKAPSDGPAAAPSDAPAAAPSDGAAESSAAPSIDDAYARERYELARAVLTRSEEKGWHLLESPARLQVFTIDGLCSRIAGSMPLLSRLGSIPAVVEDASAMMREAVRRTLRFNADERIREDLAVLFERYEMGTDRLEAQLMAMLGCRDQWAEQALDVRGNAAAWVGGIETAFAEAIDAELAGMTAALPSRLVAPIHEIAVRTRAALYPAACSWPTLGDACLLTSRATAAAADAWRQAAALLLTQKGQYRARAGLNKNVHGGDKGLRDDFGDLLEELDDLDSPAREALLDAFALAARLPRSSAFSPEGRSALAAFTRVLLHAYAELWIVFGERREVDYTEIALRATAALGVGETLEKLDARIEHILVDEFQDTSVLQCSLLRGLMSGWQAGDGRTLFLVGDPMQSIYRFRKAEVGLFLAVRESGGVFDNVDAQPLTLAVNFRSDRFVLDWVNGVFALLLGDHDDASLGLVAYAPARPSPRAGQGVPTRVLLWNDAPVLANPANSVALEVAAVSAATRVKGADCDGLEARGLAALIGSELLPAARARGGRVAILVRARSHALAILRALEEGGVRVKAPGLDKLSDRAVVRDLESLTRAIVHLGDRVSQLAVLRGPLVGLGMDDLTALVEPSVAATRPGEFPVSVPALLRSGEALAKLSEDGRTRAAVWRRVQSQARLSLGSRALDVVVRTAWLGLGGPVLTDVAGALDAEAFFDLLARTLRQGGLDLDVLSGALARQDANVDPDPEIDVEVLTMHGAKGLEFDTVVLPALANPPRGGDALPLAMETEPRTGVLRMVAPREARGRDDEDKDKHEFLAYREKRRERQETLRLLYVAATRAEHCLVLSASAGRLTKTLEARSGSLLHALAAAVLPEHAEVMTAPVATPAASQPLWRVARGFSLPGRPEPLLAKAVVSSLPSALGAALPAMMATTKRAAHVGSVFHALAERIAAEGLERWPLTRVDEESAWIAHRLRAAGVLADEMAQSLGEVAEAARALLGDERGRWILAAHDDARSEWGLLALEGDTLTPAVLDRTFVVDGERWIIDFKTGRADPDSGPYRGLDAGQIAAAYVASHKDNYSRQLGRYRELLQHEAARLPFTKTAGRIRLGLFFVHLPEGQRWFEIED